MKKIYRVRPTVHLVTDEQGNTIRSDYSYPPCPNSHCEVLAYNRDQSPPEGDFLQEQMWVVEGPEESHALFASDLRTTEVTHAECCQMAPLWDGPKEIAERVHPGSKAICPDCGDELSCPGCGPMDGKAPKVVRMRRGWDEADHAHHFVGLD